MKRTTFWTRLTEAMRAKGLKPTQVAAGKLVGVRQTSARKWALGGYPEMATVVTLATKLEVSVEWLLTGRGARDLGASDKKLAELLTFWSQMDDEARAWLLGAAKIARTGSFTGDADRRATVQKTLSSGK